MVSLSILTIIPSSVKLSISLDKLSGLFILNNLRQIEPSFMLKSDLKLKKKC